MPRARIAFEHEPTFTLAELCVRLRVHADGVVELVEHGVATPEQGSAPADWRFSARSLRRTARALRLLQDLGLNAAGAALAVDLLDELEAARLRLARFERLFQAHEPEP
jgi:chaperone modulatory protein CbpM